MRKTMVGLLVISGLSGCLEVDQTESGFRTPSATGVISGSGATNVSRGSDSSGVTGNTYGYAAGGIKSAGIQGYAGIAPGASVSAPPPSGFATMTGDFEIAVVQSIFQVGDQLSASRFQDRGSLTLTADFDEGTLKGDGTGLDGGLTNFRLNNNVLSVDGTIVGNQLTGTVSYDGLSGPLTGLVGSDEAIGAFHGNSDSQVHAGGFIVN